VTTKIVSELTLKFRPISFNHICDGKKTGVSANPLNSPVGAQDSLESLDV
jgi:hypothetical protein